MNINDRELIKLAFRQGYEFGLQKIAQATRLDRPLWSVRMSPPTTTSSRPAPASVPAPASPAPAATSGATRSAPAPAFTWTASSAGSAPTPSAGSAPASGPAPAAKKTVPSTPMWQTERGQDNFLRRYSAATEQGRQDMLTKAQKYMEKLPPEQRTQFNDVMRGIAERYSRNPSQPAKPAPPPAPKDEDMNLYVDVPDEKPQTKPQPSLFPKLKLNMYQDKLDGLSASPTPTSAVPTSTAASSAPLQPSSPASQNTRSVSVPPARPLRQPNPQPGSQPGQISPISREVVQSYIGGRRLSPSELADIH